MTPCPTYLCPLYTLVLTPILQGLSYFTAFVLAFRLNTKSEGNKIWLLLLVPVAVTVVILGLELVFESRFG